MISTLQHSGKGETLQTVKRSVVGGAGGEGRVGGARRVLKTEKILYATVVTESRYLCLDPQTAQHQE